MRRLRLWMEAVSRFTRIRFLTNWEHGFDLGCFTWQFCRWGPFIFYREMLAFDGDPPPLGPWSLAIVLNRRAFEEFYEGLGK